MLDVSEYRRYMYQINEIKKGNEEEFDFYLKEKDVNTLDILGFNTDDKNNTVILCEDLESNKKLILSTDKSNKLYFVNAGDTYKDLMKKTFNQDVKFNVIDGKLFFFDKDKKTFSDNSLFMNFHKKHKNLVFDKPLNTEIKEKNISKTKIDLQAKEKLALSLGISSSAFKEDLNITSIERVDKKHSLISFNNTVSNRVENFIVDIKDSVHQKISDNIEVSYTTRLAFEELKNASLMIAMGFLEFYGAEFDEAVMDRDPKLILDEKGYSVGTYNNDGIINKKTHVTSLEEGIRLKNEMITREYDNEITQDDALVQEQDLNYKN